MKPLSRRQFLLSLVAGASAVAISSCEPSKATTGPTETEAQQINHPANTITSVSNQQGESTPTKANLATSTNPILQQSIATGTEVETNTPAPIPTDTLSLSTPTPASSPDLVVARGGDDPEVIVRQAIAALGGMEKYVPKGAKVIIKPNICTAYYPYEYAATTNPWVVAALVKICLEVGADTVSVMDSPFGGTAKEAYQISGIKEQVEAVGGKMVIMSDLKFPQTPIPKGKSIKKWWVYEDVLKADVLINVPIPKNHSLSRLTLGMKNLMGVVVDRGSLHQNIGQRLADLATLVYPTLTIVDAIRILTSGGPTGGNLDAVKKLDTIIAGTDIVAADSYAATLFDIQPEQISYIKAGAQMGLGRTDIQNMKIEEIAVGG